MGKEGSGVNGNIINLLKTVKSVTFMVTRDSPDFFWWNNRRVSSDHLNYKSVFYLVLLIIICNSDTQIAVRAFFLGMGMGFGIILSIAGPLSYKVLGWYVIFLTFFHYSEYLVTAVCNPKTVSLDSFLLNHSVAYGVAMLASLLEFLLERWLFPDMKQIWVISVLGVIICFIGEGLRKSAIITASTNFNHIVQIDYNDGHQLVTWGIYKYCRHPSYVGWFWWSVGTQVILMNPVCTVGFGLASWTFFRERIYIEEIMLIKFFGGSYVEYQKKVGTGLPFITGFQYPQNSKVKRKEDYDDLDKQIQDNC
ncbi:unnamed protein product, partial [Meganyctiphanes norvegica]